MIGQSIRMHIEYQEPISWLVLIDPDAVTHEQSLMAVVHGDVADRRHILVVGGWQRLIGRQARALAYDEVHVAAQRPALLVQLPYADTPVARLGLKQTMIDAVQRR